MSKKKKKPNPKHINVIYEDSDHKATYIAGLKGLEPSDLALLDSYTQLMNSSYHYSFARLQAEDEPNALKRLCLTKFGILSRHYNSNLSKIKSRTKGAKTARENQVSSLRGRIKYQNELLEKVKDKKKRWMKDRYIHRLQDKLVSLESTNVKITFGSKKLFRAQFNLAANGYKNHQEWKDTWQAARNKSFLIIGSKDESFGNQLCQATINAKGNIDLRLRLPDALVKNDIKYIYFKDIKFSHGHQHVLASIVLNQERKTRRKLETRLKKQGLLSKEDIDKYKEMGTSISYVFKTPKKDRWNIHISVDVPKPTTWHSRKDSGAIGVDLNVDHLAITETDRFGNPVFFDSIPLCTYGLSRYQALALIGEKAKELIAYAKEVGKPIILEKLDFKDKRAILYQMNAKTARMLSSFAYLAIINHIKARAYREGIHCYQVSPAYTSIIGRCKYAKALGITIHQSAALVIARRFLGFSEKPLKPSGNKLIVPVGDGDYVTLDVPVRNRRRHVWSLWRGHLRKLKPALAAHYRTRRNSRPSRSSPSRNAKKSSSVAGLVTSSFDLVGENPTRESLSYTVGATSAQVPF